MAGGTVLPEKILQIGEGNFLRGFVDWMVDGANRQGLFGGRVVVVQPIARGMVDVLNRQNGVYTLLMRGVENGSVVERKQVVGSVSRGIDPYAHFDEFLVCAHNPELRFIVSNTTEAGISFSAADQIGDRPPASFPGKLTALLLERYHAFGGDPNKGFIFLPCELIERNGDNLKRTVLETARHWGLEPAFLEWIEAANVFTNTLVDRIVTGYPAGEAEALCGTLGYQDELLDTAEPFHLWVIEAPEWVRRELPFAEAGFQVVWTDDMKPYRDRKVRILNGAHTSSVLYAYLAGKNTVKELMDDSELAGFMEGAIREEVIPTLSLPRQELEDFASAVFERFRNPFIKHALLSISLNSVSKYKARVLPSVVQYAAMHGRVPERLSFSLAALIAFYRGSEIRQGALLGSRKGEPYRIVDDLPVLEEFARLWQSCSPEGIVSAVLQRTDWWGRDLRDLPGMEAAVQAHLKKLVS